MAPEPSIPGSQSYSVQSVSTRTIEEKGSSYGMPKILSSGFTWDTHNHHEMMKKQETMKKEDLAPDWVWEYGIMG